ncbi:hypothetical protein DLY19_05700 [Escherichia coli]|nr:hypothetical protein [Escherichia coli]
MSIHVSICVGSLIFKFQLFQLITSKIAVRPSHHRNINRRQRTSFFVPKSSIRKAFLAFSLNLSQPDSIYINLLMRVQLRVFPGSIMFVPTQGP